ncbi:hypothetical protein UFOVP191_58 [uncultured Caudovirales phage]|uniref:Uncharacterized protein n=1 Tax=uncultured Caudovirales phage TaxID=2100421 RepID=A0A6J7WFV7_9CAUD|nr:hypothetical protein UFOVP191_58 [uncultured Caudovirales phage]
MIIGALSNAIRGGQWKAFVPEKYHWINSDAINATIYMATVYYLTGSAYLSLASFAAMWLGAMAGWNKYIGFLGGWEQGELSKLAYIDFFISPLKKWPRLWGFFGLSLRGLMWGICLSIPFFIFGYHAVAIKFIYLSATMGICYLLSIEYMLSRIPTGNWQGAGWGISELVYGGVLWHALTYI